MSIEEIYMKKAVALAKKGLGKTSPNPPVGALIVKDNRIIAKGYHEKAGAVHAEVMAISGAGQAACGADLYITLEPCSTYGQTPPCVDAIIDAGIKRVFIGSVDPNEKNKRKSFEKLEKSGIKVINGVLTDKTDELIKSFDVFTNKKRPYFILKAAISLDGRIATSKGDSKWITNEQSRKFVHKLRNTVDAILVGKNTFLADKPQLNVRGIKNSNKPLKIVLGDCEDNNRDDIIFINNKNLKQVSDELYKRNIMTVLIEGGAGVYTSFLNAGLADKCYFFIAPIIVGGDKICVTSDFKGVESIADSLRLSGVNIRRFGDDVLVIGEK